MGSERALRDARLKREGIGFWLRQPTQRPLSREDQDDVLALIRKRMAACRKDPVAGAILRELACASAAIRNLSEGAG
jgi:hypothetical protein